MNDMFHVPFEPDPNDPNRQESLWENPRYDLTSEDKKIHDESEALAEHLAKDHGCLIAMVITANSEGLLGIVRVVNGKEVADIATEEWFQKLLDVISELALPVRLPREFLEAVAISRGRKYKTPDERADEAADTILDAETILTKD